MSSRSLLRVGLVAFALAGPSLADAQVTELALEAGGSQIAPPTTVEGDAARYLLAGLRFTHFDYNGTGLSTAFQVGRPQDATTGGDYLSGTVDGQLWGPVSSKWYVGLGARAFGFDVREPASYRALGIEGGPAVQFRSQKVTGTLRAIAGTGRSRTEMAVEVEQTERGHPMTRPTTTTEYIEFTEDLWRYGASGEVLFGRASMAAGLAAGIHRTPEGDYTSGGVRLVASRGGAAFELRADVWDTPLGRETTGGLAFILPLDGWSFRGFFGRTEPDPLTLTEPSGGAGGVVISRRLAGRTANREVRPILYRTTEAGTTPVTVRIEMDAPEEAHTVVVLGDFTLWEPVTMERSENRWHVELEIPAGTYHFGFLVDDDWFVPEDAPDTVADEWGRRNATMVIER